MEPPSDNQRAMAVAVKRAHRLLQMAIDFYRAGSVSSSLRVADELQQLLNSNDLVVQRELDDLRARLALQRGMALSHSNLDEALWALREATDWLRGDSLIHRRDLDPLRASVAEQRGDILSANGDQRFAGDAYGEAAGWLASEWLRGDGSLDEWRAKVALKRAASLGRSGHQMEALALLAQSKERCFDRLCADLRALFEGKHEQLRQQLYGPNEQRPGVPGAGHRCGAALPVEVQALRWGGWLEQVGVMSNTGYMSWLGFNLERSSLLVVQRYWGEHYSTERLPLRLTANDYGRLVNDGEEPRIEVVHHRRLPLAIGQRLVELANALWRGEERAPAAIVELLPKPLMASHRNEMQSSLMLMAGEQRRWLDNQALRAGSARALKQLLSAIAG